MEILIREMRVDETDAVFKLAKSCFTGLERLLIGKPGLALVATINNEIIGAAMYKTIKPGKIQKIAYIEFAFIRKDCRGKGIGKQMYYEITQFLKQKGCTSVTALVADDNAASWKLFEQNGYSPAGLLNLVSLYGIPGALKVWFSCMLGWAVGHRMWHTEIEYKSNFLLEAGTFLLINLLVIIPGLYRFKEPVFLLHWISAIFILIIIPVLFSSLATLFFSSKWHFQCIRGGILTSILVSITGGSLPLIGRMYPVVQENTASCRREMGIVALCEWIALSTLVAVAFFLRTIQPASSFIFFIGRLYLVFHCIPLYPFSSFGGKRIWNWSPVLLVALLVSVSLSFLISF